MQEIKETWVPPLGWEDPREEGMETHFSILAWRIPIDRGAWWATAHRVAKSQTWLSKHTHTHTLFDKADINWIVCNVWVLTCFLILHFGPFLSKMRRRWGWPRRPKFNSMLKSRSISTRWRPSPERHRKTPQLNTSISSKKWDINDLFSSVQLLSRVWLFATPWTAAQQVSLSFTSSRSLLKLMSIESVMPSNHLILYRPLLLPPSMFPSIRVFPNESVLCIRWPKYWSFGFSISPSNEYSGLISFRIDWFDLLAVQRTFKSLL